MRRCVRYAVAPGSERAPEGGPLGRLPQDEPKLGRVGADALGELVQGSAGHDLSLSAPASRLSPASSEGLGVSLAAGSLPFKGGGELLAGSSRDRGGSGPRSSSRPRCQS